MKLENNTGAHGYLHGILMFELHQKPLLQYHQK